jgi:hypothetical protein
MRKYVAEFYVFCLWVLCGVALDSLFQSWWPSQRVFWSGIWTGGAVIALLSLIIVWPAASALEMTWGRLADKPN